MPIAYSAYDDKPARVAFEGAVLATRERNYHDDSDFYAVVWDAEKNEIRNVDYDTTRFASSGASAYVDATPETKKAADQWAYERLRKSVWSNYISELKSPLVGDEVAVVKGRKAPVGTKGVLFWKDVPRVYGGYSKWSQKLSTKVGIATSDRKDDKGRYADVAWTYLDNIEVTNLSKKFKFSEAKRRLKNLKRAGWSAWTGYIASLGGLSYL